MYGIEDVEVSEQWQQEIASDLYHRSMLLQDLANPNGIHTRIQYAIALKSKQEQLTKILKHDYAIYLRLKV